jgi:precorrin isomerase
MKHYHTLIKLKKREVDGLRKQLSNLNQQRAMLEQLKQNLIDELNNEIALAERMIDLSGFFGDFSDNIKTKEHKVDEQIESIDKQIKVITDKMMLAFGEQKKFELAQQAKDKEAQEKRDKIEQHMFDELAGQRAQL